jgi:CheY-like chemotaxis protein
MPIMNGFEATRLIRIEEQKHGTHIPIIALTAHIDPELASNMFQYGMDLHLSFLLGLLFIFCFVFVRMSIK